MENRGHLYLRLEGPYRGLLDRDGIVTDPPVAYAYLTRREIWRMVWEWVRVCIRRDMTRGPLWRRRYHERHGS